MEEILKMLPHDETKRMIFRQWIEQYGENLLERMPEGHFTASGFIFNPEKTKTLMVFHNIYQSWAWTGGHADGKRDLLAVALREAREETGVQHIRPIDGTVCAADILPVAAHSKSGRPIAAHVHLNVTFALECEEADALRVKPDENSAVGWIPLAELPEKISPSDAMMIPIYEKIIRKYAPEFYRET